MGCLRKNSTGFHTPLRLSAAMKTNCAPACSISCFRGSNWAMRLTQFGHHVPRRNSRITAPCARKEDSEKLASRLAAASEKSGATEPTARVSVRSAISISTVREQIVRDKGLRQRGTSIDTSEPRVRVRRNQSIGMAQVANEGPDLRLMSDMAMYRQ